MQKKKINLHPVIFLYICNLVSMAELSINTLRPMLVLKKMTIISRLDLHFLKKEDAPAPLLFQP